MSEPVIWLKATASGDTGQCVELADLGDAIGLRDSKNPDGPVLRFTRGEIAAFLDGASRGEFADLT